MSEEFPFTTPEGSDARMFIQWKGTDVCLDFQCSCQPEEKAYAAHFDGYFAYFIRCPACGAVYEMGTQVIAKRVDLELRPEVLTQGMGPVDLDYHGDDGGVGLS